jgi:hypothetical protein
LQLFFAVGVYFSQARDQGPIERPGMRRMDARYIGKLLRREKRPIMSSEVVRMFIRPLVANAVILSVLFAVVASGAMMLVGG